jgi:hypothetical protein
MIANQVPLALAASSTPESRGAGCVYVSSGIMIALMNVILGKDLQLVGNLGDCYVPLALAASSTPESRAGFNPTFHAHDNNSPRDYRALMNVILGKDLQLVGNLGDCYYREHGKSD